MQTRVLLYSSDASDLYKADVFRVLALPDGHTIQFRYGRKYVLEEFREKPEALVGKEAVIFFLAGNDQSKLPKDRQLSPYPIRACVVESAFYDSATQQIILILKLGAFISCKLEANVNQATLPPSCFVTRANIEDEDLRVSEWKERVDAVQVYFPDVLFYRINAVLHGNTKVAPKYSDNWRISYYEIQEEADYSLECNYYDRAGGKSELKIEVGSEDLDIDNSFEWGGGARLDTKRLPLTTRTLKSRSAPARMKFHSPKPGGTADPNFVDVRWQLKQAWAKPGIFWILTTFGAIGVFLSQAGFRNQNGDFIGDAELTVRAAGMLLVGFIASQLFKFFNKI